MDPDVIIVGAGVAGLAAAGALTRSGRAVEILEARNRIGGRIHTVYDPSCPVPIELGAEFVHGRPPEIRRLVDSGQLAAVELNAEDWVVRDGRPQQGGNYSEKINPLMKRLAGAEEQSFEQFIQSSGVEPDVRQWATAYVEGFNAARRERISVKALAQMDEASEEVEGERAFRLMKGYGAPLESLWRGIETRRAHLRLGAIVDAIRWRRGHVEVSARALGKERRFYAPRAIVTVPLGVLQAGGDSEGAIRFDPEPGALRAAREGIAMGHALRITLRFRRPVWEDREEFRNLGFLFSEEPWMPTWWTTLPVRARVITGWTAGSALEDSPAEYRGDPLPPTLRTLARLLRTDETSLRGELEAVHTYDWSADPFARGAYSYVRPGGMDSQQRLGEAVENTLYFAGEAANADGHAGTVHGAIASGERAALQILE